MKQWISKWLVGVCLFASASVADANPHFISTDEVELGMTGYAKTVVEGAEIESFDVKVIGFADKGAGQPLVLIQVSGDVIERTGGVVQGMSGSPVYINGRLLGAIAYGYKFGDATKCMVTPIGEMTAMWDLPDPLNNPLPR
ncbi:MAG: peptidase S55 SpoIVB, partial [Selenomonadales bacterium]|nr:peptidase S55 SpoIVB [Selenomonadales bacterium]